MEINTSLRSSVGNRGMQRGLTKRTLCVTICLVFAAAVIALPAVMRVAGAAQLHYTIVSLGADTHPSAAKIGDIDGNGLNDIAVVNTQGNLQLFFNNGSGSFERVSMNGRWPATSNTSDVDIGDLNGDGRNDLAVSFSTPAGAISVLLNQGNRSFSPPENYDSCSNSNGVAIGDLDQDGDNDIADISECSRSSILLNNGAGGLTLAGAYGSGSYSRSIALADFNRDGFKDIAYLNGGIGLVTVLFNNGNGSFREPTWLYDGDSPDDLTVGDFDGDGNIDIAIANSYYSLVIIMLNDSHGTFPGYSELSGGLSPTSIAAGDFDGDGRLDYAVASRGMNSLSLFLNQGNYNFADGGTFYVPQNPIDVEAGDLDGDSIPDLVAVNQGSGSIAVLLSSVEAPPPPPPPPAQITLTVSTSRTKTARLVELRWSGAPGANVDIYRNGSRLTTVSNSGRYTDRFGRNATGTFTYKVCSSGSQQCSNQSTIGF
jgi:hypothetical protein